MIRIENQFVYDFGPDHAPAAECEENEIIQFVTEDALGGQVRTEQDHVEDIDFNHTNPATGPLYVRGAEVGDVLAVDILQIDVAGQGAVCTLEGYGCMWDQCELRTRILPVVNGAVTFNDVTWPIRPMVGVIGTASDEAVSSGFSFNGGGNMDSRMITAGSTVYFPVRTSGALLSMGDLHASMGDGEVCETGIEIAGCVTVRVRLIKQFALNWPVTETQDRWYVNTNGNTADKAIIRGYRELTRLISAAYGWDTTDAVMYLSLQAYVEANQACLDPEENDNEGATFRVGCPKVPAKPPLIG